MAATRSVGYKGKILKGNTNILGMAEWSYSGETRKTEASNLFNYQYEVQTPTTIEGGEIAVSGDFLIGDPGLALIEEAFHAGSELTDLKLYVDADNYFIPDPNTTLFDGTSNPSHVIITKSPTAVKQGASGIARTEFSAKVSGRLILQGADTSELICETIGACNFDNANSNLTIIGRVGGYQGLNTASELHVLVQAGKSVNGLVTLNLSEVIIVSELLAGVTHKSPVFAITSDIAEGYGSYFFRAGIKRVDKTGVPIVYGGIQSVYVM
jgi:hypothetical protein